MNKALTSILYALLLVLITISGIYFNRAAHLSTGECISMWIVLFAINLRIAFKFFDSID